MAYPFIGTNWIWAKDWSCTDETDAQFVCFRKEIQLQTKPTGCHVKISADSRYKLYVNGIFVQEGPAKGDREVWYYDEAACLPYLHLGKNVLAVLVLRYPQTIEKRNHSLHRTDYPNLYIEGSITLESQTTMDVSGKTGWKCLRQKGRRLVNKEISPAPLHILEEADGSAMEHGWTDCDYDDALWSVAQPYGFFALPRGNSPCHLQSRPVPYQQHTPGQFKQALCVRSDSTGSPQETTMQSWNAMLQEQKSVAVPPCAKVAIEIDAGELMTGFITLAVKQGKGAKITLVCAESYANFAELANKSANIPVKTDRCDFVNGTLFGYEDVYLCGGHGTDAKPEQYTPYWFRTFRFVGITVETGNAPLQLCQLNYLQTEYPLQVTTQVETSDESLAKVWDISLRTLRRCMHETYMDCPFFEQLQYAMDSRSQILFTYALAADDRLARQCMDDFRRSQRSDGTLNSCAPSCTSNVIPGFSIFYILMVHDHMMYFGDKALVKEHLPTMDRILRYFERNCTENGLVGVLGGPLMRAPYWSFIDWTIQWNECSGVPTAIKRGPLTMESLLYVYGLQHAAELAAYVGRTDVAAEYRSRAHTVQKAIRQFCIDENGLVTDGPNVAEYSVHCQVFALLTDTVSVLQGKQCLKQTLQKNGAAQCSVAMDFYLFRALEKANMYEYANTLFEKWRKLIALNGTTCVENDTDGRSECHAWGATILYELPAVVLGVRPAEPGYKKVKIKPTPGYLRAAHGKVITPRGIVEVAWKQNENGTLEMKTILPPGMEQSNA